LQFYALALKVLQEGGWESTSSEIGNSCLFSNLVQLADEEKVISIF